MIEVSAPAKLILFGEHAVVYGKPAVAVALSRRSNLRLRPLSEAVVRLQLPDLKMERSWSITAIDEIVPSFDFTKLMTVHAGNLQLLQDKLCAPGDNPALKAFLYLLVSLYHGPTPALVAGHEIARGSLSGMEVTIASDVPVGAGLGSSAAYAVCLAAALLQHRHPALLHNGAQPQPPGSRFEGHLRPSDAVRHEVNQWAYLVEQVLHGTPSGLDNAVSTQGGALRFVRGTAPSSLPTMPVLRVLLTNTKVEGRSTKELVAGVRRRFEDPTTQSAIQQALDDIEKLVEEGLRLLEQLGKLEATGGSVVPQQQEQPLRAALASLVSRNGGLLSQQLGVGHPAIDQVAQVAAKYGLSSKLTGAGGGGCVITYIASTDFDSKELQAELTALGYDCYDVEVGGPGLLVKQ
jgi:mevalonate kinase